MNINSLFPVVDLAASQRIVNCPSESIVSSIDSNQHNSSPDAKELTLLSVDSIPEESLIQTASMIPGFHHKSQPLYSDSSISSVNNSDDGVYEWDVSTLEPRSDFILTPSVYSYTNGIPNDDVSRLTSANLTLQGPMPTNWTKQNCNESDGYQDLFMQNIPLTPESLPSELRTDGESSDDSHEAVKIMRKHDQDTEFTKSFKKHKPEMSLEERRQDFLERNRLAALKCRQRKKQWTASLQSIVGHLSQENETLVQQNEALRQQNINLKAMLLTHKDCNITKAKILAMQTLNTQAMFSFSNPAHWDPSFSTVIKNEHTPHVMRY